jgi:arylsulfatase A-like enzyme
MADYMKSLHYMDEGFSLLFKALDNDPALENTTLVITGDHTIFYPDQRKEYDQYCRENGLDFGIREGYCPLIIYSPQRIKEAVEIHEQMYQMDIYPTLIKLLGCEAYYWQGMGVDLLDSTQRHERKISEARAYELCDKIIRSNYFESQR